MKKKYVQYFHFGTGVLAFRTIYIIIWDDLLFKLILSPETKSGPGFALKKNNCIVGQFITIHQTVLYNNCIQV